MNTLYIICLTVFAIIAIYTYINQNVWHNSHIGWRSATGIGSFVVSFIMLFFSFANVGETIVENRPANVLRMGDELFLQAKGWPTQSTTEIRYLDKELSLTRTSKHNAYGLNENDTYTIEPVIKTPL